MSGMTRRRIRALVVGPVLLTLLLASLLLYAHFLIHKPSVQKDLVERLSRFTGYHIQADRIELSLWGGIGLMAYGFEAASPEGAERVEAESLLVTLNPRELLRGRVVPVSLALARPTIQFDLPEEGAPGIAAPSKILLPWFPGLESLSLERSTLVIRNRPYNAEALNLEVRSNGSDPLLLTVNSSGLILYRDRKIPFRTHGTVTPPMLNGRESGPFTFHSSVEAVPLSWVPWPDKLSFEGGTATAEFSVEGTWNRPIKTQGRITFRDVRFILSDDEQTKYYDPPEIFVGFHGQVDESGVSLPGMTLITEDLSLGLDLEVDLPREESPRVRLRVESEPMSLAIVERYFPAPLLPSWMESRLFPILRSGTVRLEHLIIAGAQEEIENMDEPENAGAFSLSVDCRDFLIAGPSLPDRFTQVAGRVTYFEGDLLITDLEGSLDDSIIREGRLEVRRLLEEHSVWDILVDGDFRVRTLLKQRGIVFIPPDAFLSLNRLGPMTGTLESRAWFRYETGWDFPRLREGLFVIHDSLLHQPELLLPVKLSRAEIRVVEDGEDSFQVSGAWGASRFEAGGAVEIDADAPPFQSAEVFARLDMNEALPVLLRGFELPLAFDGPVATRFSLVREKDRWRFSGRVDLEEVTLRNQQVSMNPPGPDDHIDFDLFVGPGEHLELEKVLCRFRGSQLEISGGYDLERKDLLTMELSSQSLDLGDLGLRFHDHGRPSQGLLKGRVKIMASRREPLSTMVLGNIQGADISAQLHRLPSPVRDASFSIDFSGKSISVANCRMRVGESELEIRGDLEGWRRIMGELSVHIEFLNPEDFLRRGATGPREGPLIPEFINVRLLIHGGNAHWKKLRFGPLQAEIHLTDGEIRLARSRIRLENGVLTTSGHIRRTPEPALYLSNHVRLTGQPVRGFLETLDIYSPFLQGTLNMEAFLTLEGRNADDLLPSLSGNADVAILNGGLRKTGVFSKILEMMSLEKLIKGKPDDLPEGSFYFESMKGFAAVDRGVVSTENFIMSSPIYNAVAAGEADLIRRTVAFTLGIQPLETLDTVVSRIPIIGYALTGKERAFLTYYFEVTGPMSEPSTRHIPFQNLGGRVAGVLKRLFLTPLRLYENLSGGKEPPAEQGEENAKTP